MDLPLNFSEADNQNWGANEGANGVDLKRNAVDEVMGQ